MVGRCSFVLKDTHRGVKGKVGRAPDSQEHKHRVPCLQSLVGNGIFRSTKVTFGITLSNQNWWSFRYHKVMSQLEGAQKTSEKWSKFQMLWTTGSKNWKSWRCCDDLESRWAREASAFSKAIDPLLYLSNTRKAATKRGEKYVLCVQVTGMQNSYN